MNVDENYTLLFAGCLFFLSPFLTHSVFSSTPSPVPSFPSCLPSLHFSPSFSLLFVFFFPPFLSLFWCFTKHRGSTCFPHFLNIMVVLLDSNFDFGAGGRPKQTKHVGRGVRERVCVREWVWGQKRRVWLWQFCLGNKMCSGRPLSFQEQSDREL